MNLDQFNKLGKQESREELIKCCSSLSWVENMSKHRPYSNIDELGQKAEEVWFKLAERDWLEAFEGHPMIGDVKTLKEKYANTAGLASGEQSSVEVASEEVIHELAKYNKLYLDKFGFIFIVCATGKSAVEMLEMLRARYENDRNQEIQNASVEQNKITKIRLEKMLCTQ